MERTNHGYLKTRDAAREAGEQHYDTGKRCKHGHRSPRFVSTCGCVECGKLTARRTYDAFCADEGSLDWRD
jgi:hypothetical protein